MSLQHTLTCDLCAKQSGLFGNGLPKDWIEGKIELFDATPTLRFHLCPECRGQGKVLTQEVQKDLMGRLLGFIRDN